eukprot:TRINITY_DN12268_c0_g1_i2.p1 TRINITY_DN12268_c0_g1~~TRINITY_DN12268_c0_g1_i2.p1  ORF type:complete len:410 (+),score=76.96 TRINITY_DN12268_c0_g1_i2:60-1289(+)
MAGDAPAPVVTLTALEQMVKEIVELEQNEYPWTWINYGLLKAAALHDPERYIAAVGDIHHALGSLEGKHAPVFEFLSGVTGAIHEGCDNLITESYARDFATTLKVYIEAAVRFIELDKLDEEDRNLELQDLTPEDVGCFRVSLETIGKMSPVFMTTFAAAPKSRALILDDERCMRNINLMRYPGTDFGIPGDFEMVHQVLAMLVDQHVTVIDPKYELGYEVTVSGVAKNHFYDVLLRDALCRKNSVVDQPMNGEVPTADQVAACNIEGAAEDCGSGWGMEHWTGLRGSVTEGFSTDRGFSHIGWGSMTPDDFPKFRGVRYVLVNGEDYVNQAFVTGMIFPSIPASVTPIRKLDKSEVLDILDAMTTCPAEEYTAALLHISKRGNGSVDVEKVCALRERGWVEEEVEESG